MSEDFRAHWLRLARLFRSEARTSTTEVERLFFERAATRCDEQRIDNVDPRTRRVPDA